MTNTAIICYAIILLYTLYLLTEIQKGTNIFKKNLATFTLKTQKSKDEIYQLIFTICQDNKYAIEFFDDEKSRILLSQSMTLLHGGFFYPITISPQQDNTTKVTISVKSKLLWSGLLIFKNHRNLCNLIKIGLSPSN